MKALIAALILSAAALPVRAADVPLIGNATDEQMAAQIGADKVGEVREVLNLCTKLEHTKPIPGREKSYRKVLALCNDIRTRPVTDLPAIEQEEVQPDDQDEAPDSAAPLNDYTPT